MDCLFCIRLLVLGLLWVALGTAEGPNATTGEMAVGSGATNASSLAATAPQRNSTREQQNSTREQQERHWSSHVQRYDRWLDEQQYCIEWCSAPPAANQSRDLHPDFPPNSTARQHAMSLPPYRGQLQGTAEQALNVTCCHVCTAKCFATVVETRNQGFRGDDVTLVTVSTPGRFRTLERTRQLWSGPMVVLLYSVVRPVFLQNGTVVAFACPTASPTSEVLGREVACDIRNGEIWCGEIWHQIFNPTGIFGTKFPDCSPRTSTVSYGPWLVAANSSFLASGSLLLLPQLACKRVPAFRCGEVVGATQGGAGCYLRF